MSLADVQGKSTLSEVSSQEQRPKWEFHTCWCENPGLSAIAPPVIVLAASTEEAGGCSIQGKGCEHFGLTLSLTRCFWTQNTGILGDSSLICSIVSY